MCPVESRALRQACGGGTGGAAGDAGEPAEDAEEVSPNKIEKPARDHSRTSRRKYTSPVLGPSSFDGGGEGEGDGEGHFGTSSNDSRSIGDDESPDGGGGGGDGGSSGGGGGAGRSQTGSQTGGPTGSQMVSHPQAKDFWDYFHFCTDWDYDLYDYFFPFYSDL